MYIDSTAALIRSAISIRKAKEAFFLIQKAGQVIQTVETSAKKHFGFQFTTYSFFCYFYATLLVFEFKLVVTTIFDYNVFQYDVNIHLLHVYTHSEEGLFFCLASRNIVYYVVSALAQNI